MNFKLKRIALIIVLLIVSVSMYGCESNTQDLMKDISKKEVSIENGASLNNLGAIQTDFALRLFNSCRKYDENNKNTLISPVSVFIALSMLSNGAEGETLMQIENTLGADKDELNELVYNYLKLINERNPKSGKLKTADSIWFRDDPRVTVKQDFLQINKDYYDADVYKAMFDSETIKDINNWINEKTDGMIPSIIDDIPDDYIMYLINALSFDAEWNVPYLESQVKNETFYTIDGKKEEWCYLYGEENVFLEDEKAVGFIKYYKGCQYGFVAILPKDGISVDEYMDSIDASHITQMLSNKKNFIVYSAIPKFAITYSTEMKEQIKRLGMTLAFDLDQAELENLGKSAIGNIYIDEILHKTFFAVDEKGTKAGAATVVEAADVGFPLNDYREVFLTRPFVYMLLDCNTNTPIFIGVIRDLAMFGN